MQLDSTPIVVRYDGKKEQFSIDFLYDKVLRGVWRSMGDGRHTIMIAKYITKQVVKALPEQQEIDSKLILKCIAYTASKLNYEEIAEYFYEYLLTLEPNNE